MKPKSILLFIANFYIQTKSDHTRIIDNFKTLDNKDMSKKGSQSLYSFSDAIKSRNNQATIDTQTKDDGTKTKNSQSKKLAKLLLPQASLLQTSYENTLDKFNSDDPVDNMLDLSIRAERNFKSNCILITGLPLEHSEYPPQVLQMWITKLIPHLEQHLNIKVLKKDLLDYIGLSNNDGTIQKCEGSCAFPLPIRPATFQLGGVGQPQHPEVLGVNPGGAGELFHMYQALPMNESPLTSIKNALELCTFRGISGNPFEAQAILALIYHKVDTYFAPLSQLQPRDFDIVLHRRANPRHHTRTP